MDGYVKYFSHICRNQPARERVVTPRFPELKDQIVETQMQPPPERRRGLTGSGTGDKMAGRRDENLSVTPEFPSPLIWHLPFRVLSNWRCQEIEAAQPFSFSISYRCAISRYFFVPQVDAET